MKSHAKIMFILALLVGLSACRSNYAVDTKSEQVTNTAAKIADFELPAGYSPDFSIHLMGYAIAAYNPGDGHSHLYLVQSESEADAEKLAEMLDRVVVNTRDPQTRMTIIETRSVTVRGEEAALVISEGVNSEGETYRQAAVAFQGLGGPALLILSEPVERWEQSRMDTLLASVQ